MMRALGLLRRRPLVIATAILAAAPLVLSDFNLDLLTSALVFGLAAASLDLLIGYTGMVSLGHAAYFGAGGYAAALVMRSWTSNALVLLISATAVGALVALAVGFLLRRTTGVALIMLTLAVTEIASVIAVTSSWSGGENGISGLPEATLLPSVAPLSSPVSVYAFVLVVFVVVYELLRRVVSSPFGGALKGIRSNADRLRALGYDVAALRAGAFAIAGAVAGLAGGLYVVQVRFISPESIGFGLSALLTVMLIIGGRGTLYGPVFGAAAVLLIRDRLSSNFELWQLLLGLMFIAVVYVLPDGLVSLRGGKEGVSARARRLRSLVRFHGETLT